MKKIRKVLALFNGINTGQHCLNQAGVGFEEYLSSEIDPYAIKISKKNFPNTIELGNINNWKSWDIDWSSIDLLLAGFACQSWSIAGHQRGMTMVEDN